MGDKYKQFKKYRIPKSSLILLEKTATQFAY